MRLVFSILIIIIITIDYIHSKQYPKGYFYKTLTRWSNNGETLTWIGVLRVHQKNKIDAATGLVLITKKNAVANADDISKIDKTYLRKRAKAMFYQAGGIPVYCNVKDYILHPEFGKDTYNTIAIVELFPSKIYFLGQPINWHSHYYNLHKNRHIYSVRLTDEHKKFERIIDRMELIDPMNCKKFYVQEELDYKLVWPRHCQCFRSANVKHICINDPGMALVTNITGNWILLGLSILGPGCSLIARFIDFFPYIHWIETNLQATLLSSRTNSRDFIENYATWPKKTYVFEDDDNIFFENYDNKTLVIRPKNNIAGGVRNVSSPCDEMDGTVFYREQARFISRGIKGYAGYSISLYDLEVTGTSCILIKIKAEWATLISVKIDYGFKQDNVDRFIKTVPIKKLHRTTPPKILFLKDSYDAFKHARVGTVKLNFEYINEAELTTAFFRNKYSKPFVKECKVLEEWSDCEAACQATCEVIIKPTCSPFCVPGCICQEGYLKDKNGNCILINECKKKICSGYAYKKWVSCYANCQSKCENPVTPNFTKSCPPPCVAGCVCEEGYLENKNGNCVPIDICRNCAQLEVWSDCEAACQPTCERGEAPKCDSCVHGCICKEGYLRARNGSCLLADKCPQCKGLKKWSDCEVACQATCEDIIKPTCSTSCVAGCICKKGYLMAKNETCIPVDKCKSAKCKGRKVWSDCKAACQATCEDIIKPTCSTSCVPGCICRKGYLMAKNETCIPVDECKKAKCEDPKLWSNCKAACQTTCEDIIAPTCSKTCVPGCICKEGYFMAKNETCILVDKCKSAKCKGLKVWSDCKAACQTKCEDIIEPACNTTCVPGCVCKKGYLENKNKKCIPVDKCKHAKCKDPKVWSDCKPACQTKCEDIIEPTCSTSTTCIPGCICKTGFLENKQKRCIPVDKCKSARCQDPKVWSDCKAGCQTTCEDIIEPTCNTTCVPGCICRKGLLIAKNKTCIPVDKCKSAKCHDPKVWSDCKAACQATCEDIIEPTCNTTCVPGCICKKGYLINVYGDCISADNCKNDMCADLDHKEWSDCENACQATCEDIIKPTCSNTCVPGCICKKGYLMNVHGDCISADICKTEKCQDPKLWSDCKASCQATCEDIIEPTCSTNSTCVPGCICKKGLLMAKNKTCIPVDKCKSAKCQDPKVWSDCKAGCQPTCEDIIEPTCSTNATCVPGCICKKGLLMAKNGTCIPVDNCKSAKCQDPKLWSDCKASCQATCEDIIEPMCSTNSTCVPGCICKKGLLMAKNKTCIPVDKCKSAKCKVPKVWSDCKAACQTTCEDIIEHNCSTTCVPGCICKKGFLENKEKTCIPIDKCKRAKCKNPKVWSDCKAACQATCEDIIEPACSTTCVPGCICRKGYLMAKNETCITVDKCKRAKCQDPKVWSDCKAACQATCEDIIPPTCSTTCVPGCICKKGYLMAKNKTCIPIEKCKSAKCKGLRVWSDCKAACQATCEDIVEPTCSTTCVHGCVCKKGYLINVYGDCISINKCKNKKCPDLHQKEWSDCKADCQATCEDIIEPTCNTTCVPGCVCKKGYLMNINGDCISADKCKKDKCHDPKVWSDCKAGCQATCEDIIEPTCNTTCVPGCICKKGYLENKNKTCIPVDKCKSAKCQDLKVWSDCKAACQATCEDIIEPTCNTTCVPGCVCKKGYLENKDKTCIPVDKCKSDKCQDPKVWSDCKAGCQATCEDIIEPACNTTCVPGCICKKGYLENKNKTCIPVDKCKSDKCQHPKVWSDCKAACQPTCEDIIAPTCSTNSTCVPGCICKKGFLENKKKICIPIDKCKSAKCKSTKVWSDCKAEDKKAVCQTTCEDVVKTTCSTTCVPGCVCKKGLLMAKNGTCIPVDICKREQCKHPKVWSDCKAACQATCEDIIEPTCSTNATCVPGCICKNGLLMAKNGTCIPVDKCKSSKCKDPKVWSDCKAGCQATCEDIIEPTCSTACVPGCICKKGYLINIYGDCLPVDKCKSIKCPFPSKWSDCKFACQATCEDIIEPTCSTTCIPGCNCEKGYLRDKQGICIPIDTCKRNKCQDPKVWSDCKFNCQATCEDIVEPTCSNNATCVPGCICKKGYLRDKTGTCILINICKDQKCNPDENKQWSDCLAKCNVSTCEYPVTADFNKSCPKSPCVPGCICADGYLKNKKGDCIAIDTCRGCDDLKLWSDCKAGCQATCEDIIEPTCSPTCVPGCICKEGYLMDKNKKCLKIDTCKWAHCEAKDPFTVWTDCEVSCEATCKDIVKPKCTTCVPGCVCKKGYLKDKDRGCLPVDVCKSEKCPDSEQKLWSDCKAACQATCEDIIKPACSTTCVPGCLCKEGYLMAKNETCIPIDTCKLAVCGEHKYWSDCKAACQAKCETIIKPKCSSTCVPGCICKNGTLLTSDGQCLTIETCKRLACHGRQVWSDCNGSYECPLACTSDLNNQCSSCVPGCVCKEGYYVGYLPGCFTSGECNQFICESRKTWSRCGAGCPTTCIGYYYCTCVPGCICRSQYTQLSYYNKECVDTCWAIFWWGR